MYKRQDSSNSIEHGDMKIRVDINEAFNSLEDIENLVIFSKENLRGGEETVFLKDIAVVKKSFSTPIKSKMRYNMKEAMGLMLSPEVGTNVINTGKAIDKKLDEIKKNLPMGIEIEKVYYLSLIHIFSFRLFSSIFFFSSSRPFICSFLSQLARAKICFISISSPIFTGSIN